eukprot:TRINITY_DN6318_c0_g1_i1.p1 TRINITY_DN6318_c0_g1~~TRINITY_DN6318_c0_g1_i1.p1  ORF type:complete len:234 (-),score=46.04 TRINITY_DN6318_c0_g1_i1:116-817(-)
MEQAKHSINQRLETLKYEPIQSSQYSDVGTVQFQADIQQKIYFSNEGFFETTGVLKTGLKPADITEEEVRVKKIMTNSKLTDYLLEKEYSVPVPMSVTQKKKKAREERAKTAGPKWYNLESPEMTDEIRQNLEIIRLRSFTNPRNFMKGDKELPTHFEFGTIIHDAADYYSAGLHLGKPKNKTNFVDHLIEDQEFRSYSKRKFNEIQQKNTGKRRKRRRGTQNKFTRTKRRKL